MISPWSLNSQTQPHQPIKVVTSHTHTAWLEIYPIYFLIKEGYILGYHKCSSPPNNSYYFQQSSSTNLYSKITLRLKNKEVACRRKKCFKTKTMIDFCKDHKFKLQGEAMDDYQVSIEIKRSNTILTKSKIYHIYSKYITKLG